jgi:hypothetical protein
MKVQRLLRGLLLMGLSVILVLAGCDAAGIEDQAAPSPTLEPTATDTPVSTVEELPTETPAQTPTTVPVPGPEILVPEFEGPAPTLDGKISSEEWDQASVSLFEDGSELLMMHTVGSLYVAIRASEPRMIAGNIYLLRGEEVSILHASAALGTAVFTPNQEVWELTQDFDWRCRDAGFSDEAQARRADFQQQEGWLASNSRMGVFSELEYQISLSEQVSALAITVIQDRSVHPFPASLRDDSVQMFSGGLPLEMNFLFDSWAKIKLIEN